MTIDDDDGEPSCLVHLASGIGNIVLATPLLLALHQLGFTVEVRVDGDYPQTLDLLRGWSVIRRIHAPDDLPVDWARFDCIVPAIPPFYWRRFVKEYEEGGAGV